MNTKAAFLCLSMIVIGGTLCAQIDLEGKVKDKVNQRVDERTDQAIDKGLDEIEETATGKNKKEKEAKKEKEGAKKEETGSGAKTAQTSSQGGGEDLKSFSKFDFVPGEKVIFFDDFSQDEVGDLPKLWNTNGKGEVVTTSNYPGKWFRMKTTSTYIPEIVSLKFPENFTIEFDIIVNGEDDGDNTLGVLTMDIISQPNRELYAPSDPPEAQGGEVAIGFANRGPSRFLINNRVGSNGEFREGGVKNDIDDPITEGKLGKKMRVSIAVNKQRFRLYIDEKKVYDVPKMLPAGTYTTFGLRMWGWSEDVPYEALISNVRYAEGMPDVRSKLITEGKLVTRGITFDSGSDKIKAESYGTLKDIATVLKENAAVKVKIIGHTDSDGADASNMELSKKRAAAVKNALSKEFGIDVSRMETDGKGESEPSSPNTSPEGKANNRRVEFIKL